MKIARFIALLLIMNLCGSHVRAQDMDSELSKLTEDLAAKIATQGSKKITILDFNDLQGESSGLGKYIAEQLTVDFVMSKRVFSVLDRANLKSILAEHKLTATGLIDPENAKQLGKFAGVDALVIGNITPMGGNILLTVKVITTETAEVVGAAKAKFKSDDTVQQLLSQSAEPSDLANMNQSDSPPQKPFGDLQGIVQSIELNPADGVYGYATMTLIITNTSKTLLYGVAVNPNFYQSFNLTDARGNVFRATEVTGIDTLSMGGFGGGRGHLTDLNPRSAITIVARSQVRWNGAASEFRPYHFQTEVFFGVAVKGTQVINDLKKYNLVLEYK